jgi:CRP-like cAMP-binding protein
MTDGIHIIASGCVILEWISAGGDVLGYRVATGGDYVGHRSYFAEEPRSATARTVTETGTIFLARATLRQAIEADPRICCHFAREVGRDSGLQLSRVVRNHKIPSIARLAFMLDHLTRKLGRRSGGGPWGETPCGGCDERPGRLTSSWPTARARSMRARSPWRARAPRSCTAASATPPPGRRTAFAGGAPPCHCRWRNAGISGMS